MENKNKKCSSEKHKDSIAIYFCKECNIYMCNKCENFHSELFQNHHQYNLSNDISQIFIEFCNEKNHLEKLKYFCKTHNKLCCSSCITKIKDNENGQHTDCDICHIKDIKEEKKNKLKENIKYLEDLSITLQESINQLRLIFEKINKNKEELKLKIQQIFTKIRNVLNDREDELLLEADKEFEEKYFKEDIIKESE